MQQSPGFWGVKWSYVIYEGLGVLAGMAGGLLTVQEGIGHAAVIPAFLHEWGVPFGWARGGGFVYLGCWDVCLTFAA
jgi:hypothetical protein